MKASYYNGNKSFSVAPAAAVEPGAEEVCLKVAYCGVCGTDLHIFHGEMDARVGPPRIIGHEMSGTVQSIGAGVTGLAAGDAVVVRPLVPCNECHACKRGHTHVCQKLKVLGVDLHGAMQESWTVPACTVHKLPAGISLRHAALVEPTAVACHDVARSRLSAGEDVLVIGGGPIGILIAMVARHKGANVIISEVNSHRLRIAEKLGFETLNPTTCDVGETVYRATDNKGADVVFEVSSSQAGVECMTKAAAVRARIVMVAIHPEPRPVDLFKFFAGEIELLGARVYTREAFEAAIALIESGAIDCDALITNVQGLDQVGEVLADLTGNPTAMKSLIQVNG